MQHPLAHGIAYRHGYEEGDETEDDASCAVLLQSLKIHLQAGEEHDIVESHLAEELEAAVARQDVEPMLAHEDTCEDHAHEVGNADAIE